MAKKSSTRNPLLDDILQLHILLENSKLTPTKLTSVSLYLEHPRTFFQCNDLQAVVLSLLLNAHYQNEEISVSMLIRHLQLKPSSSLKINKALAPFVEKGWLKPNEDLSCQPMATYTFNKRFLKCTTAFDWKRLEMSKPRTDFEILEQFGGFLGERKERLIGYQAFIKKCDELVQSHRHLSLPKFILDTGMNGKEKAIFLKFCLQYYQGQETLELSEIIRQIGPSREEQFHFRQTWKAGKGIFFEKGLVEEYTEAGFFSYTGFRLSKTAMRVLNKELVTDSSWINNGLFKIESPETIAYVELFHELETRNTIEKITSLITPERFIKFQQEMQKNGMSAGVSVLLYGKPGTGKTETVLQLAKASKRKLLFVDSSTIRSKWVGETEKNIRQLFQSYKEACQKLDSVPILLFNEADAIFGKRGEVSERVQQMENTLQNILLEELEKFEGILIATTNLNGNFDPAYDRRILYKVKFEEPSFEIVQQIWKSKLAELNQVHIAKLSGKYPLTGAQLENIRKKILVDRLIDPEINLTESYLEMLCRNELAMKNENMLQRNTIGFIQSECNI